MTPSGPTGDLEAPGSDSTANCKRCHAVLAPGELKCPRCGFREHSLEVVENDAITAQQTLGRANVLRLRGEYAEAIDICLTVLKIHPENVEAHVLLGDIYGDRNQVDHAMQWYELALEIDPNSGAAQDRLRNLESDLNRAQETSTQQILGVQDRTNTTNWYAAITAVVIVVMGLIAFALTVPNRATASPAKVNQTIQATDDVQPVPVTHIAEVPRTPVPALEQDQAIKELLAKGSMGDHLISAQIDPRNSHIVATYRIDDAPSKLVVAQVAKSILDSQPDSPSVTIRLVTENRVAMMADVRRLKLEEFANLQNADPSPDYFASYVVENEWPTSTESNPSRP